ncbi:TPA: DNA recombination protein RmuC [Burkholderia territorii]|uniref:DNA recombination protein RmuC n=1 Tax=Burkholderia territorii TaxID=1503055 RepID=UPI0011C9A241|nr:DNA recombination protein RmuC [Burkholderia territorii]TXG23945.1 DNA recombination protein RmuC [Burkholderia territorii]HDR8856108.1 DNA recombination protein RmuC [Burkholderia territorii]HDR8863229.1 DNA recombination protein RmuC [Burkholderia territorii]HDR8869523.1 DNA recombination protein RmuC [Burkholderia territorii]HDR8876420.1 DNA recombination protein RmuC [Burkholderia territorii]
MTTTLLLAAVVVLAVALAVAIVALVRGGGRHDDAAMLGDRIEDAAHAQALAVERLERELRGEIVENARGSRTELAGSFSQLQQTLATQLTSIATVQNNQIEGFAQQLGKLVAGNAQQFDAMRESVQRQAQQAREEQTVALRLFGDTLNRQLTQLTEANDRRIGEVRATLEQRLKEIETNNAAKLEEMRRTVDEKLHATLEQRLGESFKLVSDRLEQVHRGLGEMQTLAAGVGDLKKVLTNVKTRGTWGEVQLEALLEQMLTPDQYAKNVATVPKSSERVEFAIRLPGREAGTRDAPPVWLPIDAKFPREDYERLIDAQERADSVAVEDAARALEARVRMEARTIAEKYVAPPHTTDFALLFLPTEGLYAEILRRPGLTDLLQRDYRVTVAGPTTLTALLNSLQMGFRTLAIEQRSSEVWQVLGAVKTEFGKFGDVLARTKAQLETVTRSIEAAEQRTRVMNRKLKQVEALPGETAAGLLGAEAADGADADDA